MIVRRIELQDFRNYTQQIIVPEAGVNVFYGENAQGKTNILEAIYLCTCARSHRTARDHELIRHGCNQYRVAIDFNYFNGSEGAVEIEYLEAVAGDPQRTRSQRIVRYNGIKLDRIADLMGLFHAVIFAPEDLQLVKEGPAARRRFLDLLISQVRPSYFSDIQQYARFLIQRNRLLKMMRDDRQSGKTSQEKQNNLQIDVWNQMLAEKAAAIIEQRMIYVQRINEIAEKSHAALSSGKEKLNVKYKTVAGIRPDFKREEIYKLFFNKLKSMVNEDIERGTTGQGPHRDDLDLALDGDHVKLFASQGQQRSAALSLKLAELAIVRQDTGEPPVLLLDDVMSELDESRRKRLLENIHDAQVFVTCTDARQVVHDMKRDSCYSPDDCNILRKFGFFLVNQGQVQSVDYFS